MSKRIFIIAMAIMALGGTKMDAQHTQRENFGQGWYFVQDDDHDSMMFKWEKGAKAVEYPPQVNLPHDWGVEGDFDINYPGETGKLHWWGYARYWKVFYLYDDDLDGSNFFLEVDGAMSNPKVFCNDSLAGRWAYGYSSFNVDLTPFVRKGMNVITIELDNPNESSRWYPGGGIYRNVWLTKTPPVGIAQWGTFVYSENITAANADMTVITTLRDATGKAPKGKLTTEVRKGDQTICSEVMDIDAVVDGYEVEQTLAIKNPKLWSPDDPQLYTVVSTLEADGKKDVYTTTTGIRKIEFTKDGFYLNGERTPLNGVCLHHDAGALGAAWNTSAWVRRLNMLKQMGCNAIRSSHNPPAPELLDLCDKMGFLVMDEFSDTWTVPKKPNGYATLFDEWHEKDIMAMLLRDRNHPSIILWSIGNEVGEQGYPDKYHLAYELTEICHKTDPTRLTTLGSDNPWASEGDFRNTVDVYGFNYKPHLYTKFREANPDKPYLGSETASCISTRGFYVFPVSNDKADGRSDNFQVSSYDLYAPYWASCPDFEWDGEDHNPWVAGEFVWTGFDYIGEPTPYNDDYTVLTNFHDEESKAKAQKELEEMEQTKVPSRSSYFGIIDLAGFPKDRYWIYQSRWRPDYPMAHILPHWNWEGREGEVTPVMVYTSGDSAELFVNGKSQGLKKKGEFEYRLRWDEVVYEPGTIKVVAYKDGKKWATDEVKTTGKASKIMMAAEAGFGPGKDFGGEKAVKNAKKCAKLAFDPDGLIFVDVKVADSKGRMVPGANNEISFTLEGDGEIVAIDGGDPTSLIRFDSTTQPAFNGLISVVIRPNSKGKLTLHASSPNLKSSKLKIKVK